MIIRRSSFFGFAQEKRIRPETFLLSRCWSWKQFQRQFAWEDWNWVMPLGEDGGKIASTNGERKIHLKRSKKNIFFRLVDFELSARDEKKRKIIFISFGQRCKQMRKTKSNEQSFQLAFFIFSRPGFFIPSLSSWDPFFFVAKLVFYLI